MTSCKDRKAKNEYLRTWRKNNPELVENHYENDRWRKTQRYANDPEYRKQLLLKMKKKWKDPKFRKKRATYMKKYRQRKKRNFAEK